jgi:hypothetical protein
MWKCKIGEVIYTWTPDGKGGGVLNDGETVKQCKTIDEAEQTLLDWGEDKDDILWEVTNADTTGES